MGEIYVPPMGRGGVGSDELTATKAQVLAGSTYVGADTDDEAGSGGMVNQGAKTATYTPSTAVQTYTIPAGYHNGSGKVTINAIPSSYANITTNNYLFNSGSFGSISGGAVKGIGAMIASSNAQWCSSYGFPNNWSDATYDTSKLGYYGIVDSKYLVVRVTSNGYTAIVFKKSLALQHYKKINIVFGAFKSSFATGITEASNNGLQGNVLIDIFNISGRKPLTNDGGSFFTTSEFTSLRFTFDNSTGNLIKATSLYSLDISSINYEAYMSMRFTATYSDAHGYFWYIKQIYLSQ